MGVTLLITDEILYKEIGSRIRAQRNRRDLTQEVLARMVGLTRSSIANIELGRQVIPMHTFYKLAGALGIKPQELLPEPNELVNVIPLELQMQGTDDELKWVKSVAAKSKTEASEDEL